LGRRSSSSPASLSLGLAFALVCALLIGAGALSVVPSVVIASARVPAWDLPIRMLRATVSGRSLRTSAGDILSGVICARYRWASPAGERFCMSRGERPAAAGAALTAGGTPSAKS
jgi:hypothetical protein